MPKRIIITGAQGFVGGNLVHQADHGLELHALSSQPGAVQRSNLHWHAVDLADENQLGRIFQQVQPHAVIHTAAMANIDECETNQAQADRINIGVTQTLARLCGAGGARLVFCSSDTVFDGEHAPYAEDAVPRPINHYARTKVAAEEIVSTLGSRGVIARPALVMGRPVFAGGNSFLPALIASLQAGREVAVPQNEIRTPVDVITLARCLHELAGGNFSGRWHLSGTESLNRFEMARRIARHLGLPEQLIRATDSSRLQNRAPRPRDVSLGNDRARTELSTPLHDFAGSLSLALSPVG